MDTNTGMGVYANIAGAGGGLVASVATCPLDVVKTKLQAQRVHHSDKAYLGVLGMSLSVCLSIGLLVVCLYTLDWIP